MGSRWCSRERVRFTDVATQVGKVLARIKGEKVSPNPRLRQPAVCTCGITREG